MKFIWKENNNGLYYIVYTNSKNKENINNCSLITLASYFLKINKKTIENFIKANGGKKQLDNNYYFKNKVDVINVVNQLNKMKQNK